jgi:hypothetical protein
VFAVALAPFLGLAQAAVSGCSVNWTLTGQPAALSAVDMRIANHGWAVGTDNREIDCEAESDPVVTHWNDGVWWPTSFPVGSCPRTSLYGVYAQSANSAWAVGQDTWAGGAVFHWNGSAWAQISLPSTVDSLTAVDGAPGSHVWVAGTGVYRRSQHHWVQVWNGSVSSISVLSDSDVWVTGSGSTLVRHWNGTRWTTSRTPKPGAVHTFTSIAARSGNNVWAVGYTQPRRDAPKQTLIAHWNGTRWKRVPSPDPGGAAGDFLNSVALNPDAGAWAVGARGVLADGKPASPQQTQGLILHWTAGRWRVVPSPSVGHIPRSNVLTAASGLPNGGVWAVGSSYTATSLEALAIRCPASS